jgi:hypothetical protein
MRASELDPHITQLKKAGAEINEPKKYEPKEDEIDDTMDPSFEPLMVLVGSASAVFIIERIVHTLKNYKFGGAVVDLRGEKVTVTPAQAFDAGTIVIVKPNGDVDTRKSDSKPIDVISAIKILLGIG